MISRISQILFRRVQAGLAGPPRKTALFHDLRDGAGADGVAAFANREAQAFLQGNRRDQRYFAAHVVARHHHLHSGRQLHVPGHVRGAEIKLRTVPRKERRVTAAFFLRQHVRFRLELRVRRDRARLADYLSALHVFFFRAAQQQPDVVASQSLIQQLLEHFDAGDNLLLRLAEAHDFHFFADLHLAAFDSSGHHRAAAGNRENVFNRHRERFIYISNRQRNVRVHRGHQFIDFLFPCGIAIQRLQRRTAHHGNRVAGELVALQQLANFEFHEFEQLRVFHHVALVQEHHDGRHTDLASQKNVLAGLRHRAVRRRNDQNRAIHLRRAGDHVLDVVGVARAIHVRVVPVRGFILHVRNRDRDPALALFRRVVNRVERAERYLRVVFRQHLGNCRRQRRLAMIDVPDRPDVHVRLGPLKFLFRHCFLCSSMNNVQAQNFFLPTANSTQERAGRARPLQLLFPAVLLDDLFRERRRQFRVVREVHGERGAPLGAAAKIGGIAEHLREGNLDADDVAACAAFGALNGGTSGIQVAENGRHVFLGNHDFHFHDGLEKNRFRARAGFLKSHRARDFESHFVRVDIVVAAVDENHGDIHHREASENPVVERFADARFDGRNEFTGNRAADDFVDKEEAVFLVELPFAWRAAGDGFCEFVDIVGGELLHIFMAGAGHRVQFDFAVSVLALTAGLLDVAAFGERLLANRFAIGNLGASDVGLHIVFAQHAVDDDFKVKFTHAGDQGLAGIGFGGNAEGRIFLREALQGDPQLVLVRLGFRLDGDGNHGSRKVDRLKNDLLVFVAQRVAGVDALQSDASANIAGVDFVDFFTLVRMHLQQAADAFAGTLSGIHHVTAGLEHAGVDANVGDVADERVGHNFESQRGERLIVSGAAENGFVVLGIDALDGRNVDRGRQVINDGVKQGLNALVLESGAGKNGNDFQRQCGFADRLAHFLNAEGAFGEVLVEDGVIVFGNVLHHFAAMFVVESLVDGGTLESGGDVGARVNEGFVPQFFDFEDFKLGAEGLFQPHNHFLFEEVDDADEIVFAAEGELQGNGMRAETLANGADDVVKVRAHAVHLVDEANARNAILVGLAPHSFRLRLHACDGVENADGAVENAQRALDLHREIHVAGRINNVDAVFFVVAGPTGGGGGAGDGDAALALLLHPVHGGRAFVHRTNLVGDTRIEQDALGRRSLSGVDVRHNPDIAGVFEFKYSAHSPLNGPFLPGSSCDRFTHGYHQIFLKFNLPTIVGESLVGFGHAVHIFLLLDGAAAGICRVDQFICELFHHGLAGALARILQEPANGQGLPAEGIHFHRHLIVVAADAPGLDLDERLEVLNRLLENLEGIVVGLLGDLVHRAVEHALRGALLAFPHHRADELLNDVASVDRIQRLSPTADYSFTRHFVSCSFENLWSTAKIDSHIAQRSFVADSSGCRPLSGRHFAAAPPDLGRFAPYFERPCLRFSTPAASSVPRTM